MEKINPGSLVHLRTPEGSSGWVNPGYFWRAERQKQSGERRQCFPAAPWDSVGVYARLVAAPHSVRLAESLLPLPPESSPLSAFFISWMQSASL